MSNVMIIDDLVPKEIQNRIEHNFVLSDDTPWFFHPYSCDKYDIYMNHKNVVEGPQFVHYLYDNKKGINSDYCKDAFTIINLLKQKYDDVNFFIHRIKANLQLQNKLSNPEKHACPHRDFYFKHHVFLYYINDSDGDTFLFNEIDNGDLEVVEKITPKKGRIICFDGKWLHASSLPYKSEYRSVFNMDIEVTSK